MKDVWGWAHGAGPHSVSEEGFGVMEGKGCRVTPIGELIAKGQCRAARLTMLGAPGTGIARIAYRQLACPSGPSWQSWQYHPPTCTTESASIAVVVSKSSP